MANLSQALAREGVAGLQLLLPETALKCLSPLSTQASRFVNEENVLTAYSPVVAYGNDRPLLAGCMCLDHWGGVEGSDLTPDDTKVHVLQPRELCDFHKAGFPPYCRAQSLDKNKIIDCDCQAWPKDNAMEPYQINNPCLQAPYTTSVLATCTPV